MFYSSPEDRTAMDTDSDEPQSTPLSHQCVLDTMNAVCTQDSVVRDVIPRLVEHAKHLCHGKRSESFCERCCIPLSVAERFGGALLTSTAQSGSRQKCRQTHHWALNFWADSPWAKSPIFDFHVPNNAICFPTKLCLRFVFNFLMDDC